MRKHTISHPLIHSGLFLLLLTAMICSIILYVRHEHFFYFFDWGGFQSVAIDLSQLFFNAPKYTLTLIKDSMELDYNDLFAIPLIPLIKVLGNTRLGYILSLGIAYQLPYLLVFGLLATKLIVVRKQVVFWLAVFVALINPLAWAPMLRGYADIGGAVLLLLALYIYLYDLELKAWWQIVAIGGLTALAVIFRRHFAYSVIAFYMALSIQIGWLYFQRVRRDKTWLWLVLLDGVGRIALTVGIFSLTLWFLARPLVEKVLTINYGELYASYVEQPSSVFSFFGVQYGWAIWFLAGLGIAFGIITGVAKRQETIFTVLFGCLALLAWVFAARQFGVHYTLQTTFLMLTGLTLALVVIFKIITVYRHAGSFALVLYSAVLFINIWVGLSRVDMLHALRDLLPTSYPPLLRTDYDTVVHLVDELRTIAPPDAPVYVADSSYLMNFDLLAKAEKELYGWDQTKLTIFLTPQVDSRDFYPLEMLLQSQYIIVTTPYQFHLPAEEQDILRVVGDAFTQNWELAQDFAILPEQFELETGAILQIYQRIRPTSWQTAVRTFNRMRQQIGARPGNQLDWINLGAERSTLFYEDGLYLFPLAPDLHDGVVDIAFLYADDVPEKGKLVGSIDFEEDVCDGVSLGIKTISTSTEIIDVNSISLLPPQSSFELAYQGNDVANLIFSVEALKDGAGADQCNATLHWKLVK